MPTIINKVRKAKVKQGLLQGKSGAQALRDAGYSKATAEHHAHEIPVLKCVMEEICRDFKLSDLTPEQVIKELHTIEETAFQKGDNATAGRMAELKGKYLALFTDKQQIDAKVLNQQETKLLDEYIHKSNVHNRIGNIVEDSCS